MLVELYGNYYLRQTGLPVSYARFFNSYGPGEVPGQYRNVIPNFIYWAMNKQALPITGTGEETRDFTFVGDIVDGLLRMAHHKNSTGEAYNLATQHERQILYLAELINELTGNPAGIEFKERRKWDSKPRLCASNEKARNQLGCKFDLNFDERIKDTIKWFETNWDNINKSADFGPGISSAVRK
jgi:Nucleoside-diphosphate-sugar epimerases